MLRQKKVDALIYPHSLPGN